MLNKIKNYLKNLFKTHEQKLYVERAKRHGRGPSFAVEEQNRLCATKKCGREAYQCFDAHGDGVTLWLEESNVIHCCADGSQFSYKARMGIGGMYCAFLDRKVEIKVFEASVISDILFIDEIEFDFTNKSFSSVIHEDKERGGKWVTTYRRPMFGVRGIYSSWDEFRTVLETEMDERTSLRDFHVETAPYDEETRYQWRVEK